MREKEERMVAGLNIHVIIYILDIDRKQAGVH